MSEASKGLMGNRPNVLFILVDQLRADVCGAYGGVNIATPHMDRLANEGVVFDNAIASCPVCSPYRGMLMTGRYPTQTGILLNFVETSVAQNPNCIANTFSKMGYDTGYIGKWHLAAGFRKWESIARPDFAAIERYVKENPHCDFVPPGPDRLGFEYWAAYNFNWTFRDYWYYGDTPEKQYSGRYETDTQAGQAIEYMRAQDRTNRPFFLIVSPHPPHAPMTPEESPPGYLDQIPDCVHWSPNVPKENPRSLLEMRCYLAMAKSIDDNLGRMLDYLDASGLAENTIVVFTSDHGEMHGSHGRVQKMAPYAEALNVPLIIRWPKRTPRGGRNRTIFTPLDYFPTLTSLAGLPAPARLAGKDLSDVVLGHESVDRGEALIANYSSNWDFCQTGTDWPEWRGVRTERHTYVRWLAGGEELYDNDADPFQLTNLAKQGGSEDLLRICVDERNRLWRRPTTTSCRETPMWIGLMKNAISHARR